MSFQLPASSFQKIRGHFSLWLKTGSWQLAAEQRGFTLLLAALVASIVLALGTSIYTLAQKQVMLSSLGRDSQFAFYAADTAAECALYWDFRYGYFGTSTPSNPAAQNPTCDLQPLKPFNPDRPGTTAYPYTMVSARMNLFSDTTQNGGYCAQVSVEKCDGPIAEGGSCAHATPPVIHTLIHADGYNVNCAAVETAPQALQRTAEWRY